MLDYITYPGVEATKYIPWELLSARSVPLNVHSMINLIICYSNKRAEKRKLNENDIFQQLEQQEKSGGGRVSINNEEEKEESEVIFSLSKRLKRFFRLKMRRV